MFKIVILELWNFASGFFVLTVYIIFHALLSLLAVEIVLVVILVMVS